MVQWYPSGPPVLLGWANGLDWDGGCTPPPGLDGHAIHAESVPQWRAVDDCIRLVVTSSGFGLSGAVWVRERRLDAAEWAEASPDGDRDP